MDVTLAESNASLAIGNQVGRLMVKPLANNGFSKRWPRKYATDAHANPAVATIAGAKLTDIKMLKIPILELTIKEISANQFVLTVGRVEKHSTRFISAK